MVRVEYWNGKEWVYAGGPFGNEHIAWISLGGDDINYRTVDVESGKVLTDKRIEPLIDEQVCRVCGCTWNNACPGGCYWVEDDLCSKCEKEKENK